MNNENCNNFLREAIKITSTATNEGLIPIKIETIRKFMPIDQRVERKKGATRTGSYFFTAKC